MRYDGNMAILGIDEVGRGPWAGPLVVGACVLREEIAGLTDSKKLSAKRREELNELIVSTADFGLGWVDSVELDKIGLAAALRKATIEAVRQIRGSYAEIVIDGTVIFLAETGKGRYVTVLKKADLLIPAVSAAAIVAKVARDRYMMELAARYPEYGFAQHVGYGTQGHRQALREYGPCPEHRKSFRPVSAMIAMDNSLPKKLSPAALTTRKIGDRAEARVAEYLERTGHTVVGRNWKTQRCEIDIVSVRGDKIYFTEVKYRKVAERGSGLEVVGATKLRQMKFAAESYLKAFGVSLQPLLAVASVAGADYGVENFLVLR